MVEVAVDQLRRWASILTAADSCMSLVYWRGGITEWDTVSTPKKRRWEEVMDAARRASGEVHMALAQADAQQPVDDSEPAS